MKKHLLNYSLYVSSALFLKGISFFLMPLYLRVFTPAEYGMVNIMVTYSALIATISAFGLPQVIFVNYYHLTTHGRKELVSSLSLAYCIIGGLTIAGGMGYLLLFSQFGKAIPLSIKILSLFTAFLAFYQNTLFTLLRLRELVFRLSAMQIALGVMVALINCMLILVFKKGIVSIFIADAIANATIFSYLLTKVINEKLFTYVNLSLRYWNKYLQEGAILLSGQIATYVQLQAARWALLKFSGFDQVGEFSVAQKIIDALNILVAVQLMNVYTPYILKKFNENPNRLQEVELNNQKVALGCVGIGLVLAFAAILMRPLFGVFVGNKYGMAFLPMVIMIPGQFLYMASQMAASGLVYKKKLAVMNYGAWSCALVNAALNIFLIPRYGLAGAALANTIGFLVGYIYVLFFSQRHMHWIAPHPKY